MASKKKVIFSDSAIDDLQAIFDFYVAQQAPDVGRRLIEKIIDRTDRLQDFPLLGRILLESFLPNVREIIYPPFRIIYRVEAERLIIIRVWRSERQLRLPEQC